MASNQRGHAKRIRNGHADKSNVERRWVDRHVGILQQRVQPSPIGRYLSQISGERILIEHHHQQKEHLNAGNDGDHVGN